VSLASSISEHRKAAEFFKRRPLKKKDRPSSMPHFFVEHGCSRKIVNKPCLKFYMKKEALLI
jgi:hypothetical protein